MRFGTTILLMISAVSAGGCALPAGTADRSPTPSRWAVAVAIARSAKPGDAVARAAADVRKQMGDQPVRAVMFLECYDVASEAAGASAAIQAAFPRAEVIGCSVAGVAIADASVTDGGLAIVAIGGDSVRFSSAYAPATFDSAQSAGAWLSRQLGSGPGQAAMIAFVTPGTLRQATWDANDLLAALAKDRPGGSVVCGGGAAPRPVARVHHAGKTFANGAVVLQLAGPIAWRTGSGHELLRVGPVFQPRQITGRTISLLAGDAPLPAATAVTRWLNAQDRHDGKIGRFVGETIVPLNFELAAGDTIDLPVRVAESDRLVLMRPGPAAARAYALDQAVADATLFPAMAEGLPLALLALPAGPDNAYLADLPAVQRAMFRSPGRPAAVAFFSPAQFAPPDSEQARTSQFSNHLLTVVQLARRPGSPAPTTQPTSRPTLRSRGE